MDGRSGLAEVAPDSSVLARRCGVGAFCRMTRANGGRSLGSFIMRIGGHNVIAIGVAGVVFWVLGAAWFGFLFTDPWLAGSGLTEADFAGDSFAWMGVGAAIAVVTAIGLSVALRWGGLPDLKGALIRTLWLWLGFGLTGAGYAFTYEPLHSFGLLAVMGSYFLVGWLAMAAIIATLK
jgi:hypothetical protein